MKLRENVAMKALAFIAAVAAFTATAIMGWYQLANYSALWNDVGAYSDTLGYTSYYQLRQDYYRVKYLAQLYERRDAGEDLALRDKREIEQMEYQYNSQNTNLRWQLLRKDGTVIYGNTTQDSAQIKSDYYWDIYLLGNATKPEVNIGWEYVNESGNTLRDAVNKDDYNGIRFDDAWRDNLPELVRRALEDPNAEGYFTENMDFGAVVNEVLADDDGYTNVLRVTRGDEQYVYLPTVQACLAPNQFDYIFDADGLAWTLDAAAETANTAEAANLVMWVDPAFPVEDYYKEAAMTLHDWRIARGDYLALTIACGVLGLLLLIYLCCGAGHKKGVEGITLNWFHRLPGDVLLFVLFLGGVGAMGLGIVGVHDAYMDAPMFIQLICIGTAVGVTAALGMGAMITVCARCKARTIFRDTWIWALCAWCWRGVILCLRKSVELFAGMGRAVQAVPLVWKAVLGCMSYTLFTIVTVERGTGLWLLVTAAAALYLCRWAYQWKMIRRGTQEIIGGNPNYHIDTRHMLPDLRSHADELNNLGHAISTAVDERMKSEHFKAELITNVSHDLKTPLTSIINYVDLLKKEEIDNLKALEYIEVLDRKSQRLKKLTEDLVEASKASTGNLTVNWERIDWVQLTDQALGECGDRLEAQKLTVVRSLPEEPMWVEADGRHLWRVLDNLLSNCAKYALPGTRVYVDLRRSGDWAVLSVKNISRDPLDIPAERLMERFVRGDESRNQAGSGLGLSIAQSLTELQHGKFEISIDGDLFKAIVTLPLAGERPSLPGNGPDDPIRLVL